MENENIICLETSEYVPLFKPYSASLDIGGQTINVSYAQISADKSSGNSSQARVEECKIQDVDSVSDVINQSDYRNLHYHLYFEFFFATEHKIQIVTESEISKFRNSIVCVPPNVNHYAMFSGLANGLSVSFQTDKIADGKLPFFSAFSSCMGTVSCFDMDSETKFYLSKLNDVIDSEDYNDKLKITPLLSLLTVHLLDITNIHFSKIRKKSDQDYLKYVQQIEVTLGEIYVRDVTLSTLASKMFLSEKQVARLVKKAYGSTLSELILNKKMAVAHRLLVDSDKPVAEIAKALNFKTESYFFVLFKKKYGCTPLKYRKRFKAK